MKTFDSSAEMSRLKKYIVNITVAHIGIQKQIVVEAKDEREAAQKAKEQVAEETGSHTTNVIAKVVQMSRLAFGDDENTTTSQKPPTKEGDQGDPGPTTSKSMKDTSSKINEAGVDGLPSDEPKEEPEIVPPDPVEKTPQELMENPEDVLEGQETKDALPLTGDNPEMLESMKNKNADGDVEIPKEEIAK